MVPSYIGRMRNSCFVDIGGGRHGYLYQEHMKTNYSLKLKHQCGLSI